MKNQYIGDVGDYGKYGLLRCLSAQGISVGINWYLTANDDRTDGNHTEYLKIPEMREYDPELFDYLRTIADTGEKSVEMIAQSGILKDACFYDTQMDFDSLPWRNRTAVRQQWHQKAMERLRDEDLVFADPDNGLSVRKPSHKYAQKFILPSEILDYYQNGKQIVYYQHRPRKNEADWMMDKTRIKQFLPDAQLLAVSFNRWTCRSYIFVLHPKAFENYKRLVEQFLSSSWGTKLVNGKRAFQFEKT